MVRATPITPDALPEVGRFLHEHLNAAIEPGAWVAALSHPWASHVPNHGTQLRDEGRLVGVFCAIYSEQWLDGRLERFCNPHSWCVLEPYRSQSISLILPLLKQSGYHFTMYTPNPKVAEIFRGLKFRDLDDGLLYFPNLPWSGGTSADCFVESDPERIPARLQGELLRDFECHRSIPWLRFVAFGETSSPCLLVYKRDVVKRLPCARIIHLSHADALERHGSLVGRHLLAEGLPMSRIEARFVRRPPPLALRRKRHQPKLVLSKTLDDSRFRDLYSELAALDV
jgi:hypothetical protein